MDAFSKALDLLYAKFIYRDVLSYMVPGAITLIALFWAFGPDLALPSWNAGAWAALLFGSYVTGLGLQALGTFGYEWRRWPLLRHYPILPNRQRADAFLKLETAFYARMIAAMPLKGRDGQMSMRLERFTSLKQIHGNVSMAMIFVGIAIIAHLVFRHSDALHPFQFEGHLWPHLVTATAALLVAYVFLHEHHKLVLKEDVFRNLIPRNLKSQTPQTRECAATEE